VHQVKIIETKIFNIKTILFFIIKTKTKGKTIEIAMEIENKGKRK